jgi:TPR repeat protein
MIGSRIASFLFIWGLFAGNLRAEPLFDQLRKAALQGDAVAQCKLGAAYYDGDGVAKDATEAVKWYRKSAEQGNALAQFALGVALSLGHKLTKNPVEGYAWLSLAATTNPGAVDLRMEFERELTSEQISAGQRRFAELSQMIHPLP